MQVPYLTFLPLTVSPLHGIMDRYMIILNSTRPRVPSRRGCRWKNKGRVLILHPQRYLGKLYTTATYDRSDSVGHSPEDGPGDKPVVIVQLLTSPCHFYTICISSGWKRWKGNKIEHEKSIEGSCVTRDTGTNEEDMGENTGTFAG